MAKIDPNENKWSGSGTGDRISPCGSGVKDFVAVGFEHFVINDKPVVEVRSVCIADNANKGDEGNELRDLFFLHSEGALSRFVKFVKDGCGWTEPFDPADPSDVRRIIANRPFRAKVKATEDGKYTRHDCGWNYEEPGLEQDAATGHYMLEQYQLDFVNNATKAWEGYERWRRENPRGGYSSGGSNGGNGTADIPF